MQAFLFLQKNLKKFLVNIALIWNIWNITIADGSCWIKVDWSLCDVHGLLFADHVSIHLCNALLHFSPYLSSTIHPSIHLTTHPPSFIDPLSSLLSLSQPLTMSSSFGLAKAWRLVLTWTSLKPPYAHSFCLQLNPKIHKARYFKPTWAKCSETVTHQTV